MTRIVGPSGSRRRKRWTLFGPLVIAIALIVPTIVWASALPPNPSGGGSSSTNKFEFDGNLRVQTSQPGNLDWAPYLSPDSGSDQAVINGVTRSIPSGNNTSSCAGGPGSSLYVPADPNVTPNPPLAPFTLGNGSVGQGVIVCDGTISKQTPDDTNGYVQGGHEDQGENPVLWNIAKASSPKKTDLSEVYVYGMVFDSPFDADTQHNNLLMVFDAGRLDTNGDFHVDFEMNQKAITNCGDSGHGSETTVCQPRTAGDILVSYDSSGGGTPPVATVFEWQHPPTSGPCASSQGTDAAPTDGGCYVLRANPPQADGFQAAQGVFNSAEIPAAPWRAVVCDPTSIQSSPQCTIRDVVPANGNMEGYIDITGFLPNFSLCPGFGEITARSRSSSGINASLQDTTGSIPVNASVCGSLIIKKTNEAGALVPGAGYTVTPGVTDRTGTTVVADGDTADHSDANNGLVCLDNVLFGSYSVAETTVPAGYFGDPSSQTFNVTNASTCADRLNADGSLKTGESADVTFTNKLGSILIKKLGRLANGTTPLLGGATFQIAPDSRLGAASGTTVLVSDNGTADTTHLADVSAANGVICVDGVRNLGPGSDYTVTESSPPSGWFADTTSVNVPVHSASKCSDRLNADGTIKNGGSPDATFTNVKGSLLIRKEAKDHSCTAAGFRGTTAAPDCVASGFALFGGATFTITPSPTSAAASLDVTDGQAGPPIDANSTAGLICIDNVADPGAGGYSIVETNANNVNYTKDGSTKSVTQASISKTLCSARVTTAGSEDAKFTNTPLSQLEVIFTSSAGPGVTAATINDCQGGATQTAFSDSTFGSLPPGTYTCTIVIDP